MVLRKTVEDLKSRPKDERKAVAGSAAALIVAILLIGWAVIFFKKIKRAGVQTESITGSLQESFDFSRAIETSP